MLSVRHEGGGVTFDRPNGGVLRIAADALAHFDAHRQHDRADPEAGGVLLGRIVVERPDAVVETVTIPSPHDRRSRFAFFRARRPTQAAINVAWEASGGAQNYIGEWHTHPEDHPSPSWIDRRDWQRLARDARFEQDALFFVIVGRISVAAWEVPRGGGPASRLVVRAVQEESHKA